MKDSTVASGLDGKEQGVIIDVCPGHSSGKCGGTHCMHLPSFVIHLLCTLMTWGHLSEYVSFPFAFNRLRLTQCKITNSNVF